MVRVGGGWDTLKNYLNKHDPCRSHLKGHRKSSHVQSSIESRSKVLRRATVPARSVTPVHSTPLTSTVVQQRSKNCHHSMICHDIENTSVFHKSSIITTCSSLSLSSPSSSFISDLASVSNMSISGMYEPQIGTRNDMQECNCSCQSIGKSQNSSNQTFVTTTYVDDSSSSRRAWNKSLDYSANNCSVKVSSARNKKKSFLLLTSGISSTRTTNGNLTEKIGSVNQSTKQDSCSLATDIACQPSWNKLPTSGNLSCSTSVKCATPQPMSYFTTTGTTNSTDMWHLSMSSASPYTKTCNCQRSLNRSGSFDASPIAASMADDYNVLTSLNNNGCSPADSKFDFGRINMDDISTMTLDEFKRLISSNLAVVCPASSVSSKQDKAEHDVAVWHERCMKRSLSVDAQTRRSTKTLNGGCAQSCIAIQRDASCMVESGHEMMSQSETSQHALRNYGNGKWRSFSRQCNTGTGNSKLANGNSINRVNCKLLSGETSMAKSKLTNRNTGTVDDRLTNGTTDVVYSRFTTGNTCMTKSKLTNRNAGTVNNRLTNGNTGMINSKLANSEADNHNVVITGTVTPCIGLTKSNMKASKDGVVSATSTDDDVLEKEPNHNLLRTKISLAASTDISMLKNSAISEQFYNAGNLVGSSGTHGNKSSRDVIHVTTPLISSLDCTSVCSKDAQINPRVKNVNCVHEDLDSENFYDKDVFTTVQADLISDTVSSANICKAEVDHTNQWFQQCQGCYDEECHDLPLSEIADSDTGSCSAVQRVLRPPTPSKIPVPVYDNHTVTDEGKTSLVAPDLGARNGHVHPVCPSPCRFQASQNSQGKGIMCSKADNEGQLFAPSSSKTYTEIFHRQRVLVSSQIYTGHDHCAIDKSSFDVGCGEGRRSQRSKTVMSKTPVWKPSSSLQHRCGTFSSINRQIGRTMCKLNDEKSQISVKCAKANEQVIPVSYSASGRHSVQITTQCAQMYDTGSTPKECKHATNQRSRTPGPYGGEEKKLSRLRGIIRRPVELQNKNLMSLNRQTNQTEAWVESTVHEPKCKQMSCRSRKPITQNPQSSVDTELKPRPLQEIQAALPSPDAILVDSRNIKALPVDPAMYRKMEELYEKYRELELQAYVDNSQGNLAPKNTGNRNTANRCTMASHGHHVIGEMKNSISSSSLSSVLSASTNGTLCNSEPILLSTVKKMSRDDDDKCLTDNEHLAFAAQSATSPPSLSTPSTANGDDDQLVMKEFGVTPLSCASNVSMDHCVPVSSSDLKDVDVLTIKRNPAVLLSKVVEIMQFCPCEDAKHADNPTRIPAPALFAKKRRSKSVSNLTNRDSRLTARTLCDRNI